jgi:hypothetical protein
VLRLSRFFAGTATSGRPRLLSDQIGNTARFTGGSRRTLSSFFTLIRELRDLAIAPIPKSLARLAFRLYPNKTAGD